MAAIGPNTLLGKVLRYPLRILPRDTALPILQGPLRGKKWIVGSHIHGCWLGTYESEMQKSVAKEIKPGDVFYDVGANVGFYSLLGAVVASPGKVYAFEPLSTNIDYLVKHLKLNKIHNVEVIDVAVSDAVGSAPFQAEETRAMGRLGTSGGVYVRTSTLDALIKEQKIAPPCCIKMDIEGAEFRALLGAKQCFARYRPKLFLATHGESVQQQCRQLLKSWNYELHCTYHRLGASDEFLAVPKPVSEP